MHPSTRAATLVVVRWCRLLAGVVSTSTACVIPSDPEQLVGEAWAPDHDASTLRWQGEFVEVWASDSLKPCEGSLQYLDLHARRLVELAERRGVQHHPYVRFEWLDEEAWEAAPCSEQVLGCARGNGVVHSRTIPHVHELTHEVLREEATPVAFLSEGLASVFGDELHLYTDTERPHIREAIVLQDIEPELYPDAAQFVRFLLEQQPDAALPAILATREGMAFEMIGRTFSEHGIDLEGTISEFEETDPCEVSGSRIGLADCARPPVPSSSEGSWQVEVPVACEDLGTVNAPVDALFPGHRWTVRTVDIGEAGIFAIDSEPDVAVRIGRCGAEPCEPVSPAWSTKVVTATGDPTLLELGPGTYWLRILWEKGAVSGSQITVAIDRR